MRGTITGATEMIPYARLTPGRGFRPGRAALYFPQRLINRPALRRSVTDCIAAAIRLRHGSGGWHAPESDTSATVAALNRDGLAMLAGDLAPEAVIARIAAFFDRERVLAPNGALVTQEALPPGATTAAYPLETILGCSDVVDLINAPAVLRIAEDYLGCKPTLSSLGVRWSFPSGAPPEVIQQLHRDRDDWRSLKFFIYLTDVDAGSGPHLYVRGSHLTPARFRAKPYSRPAVEAEYGADHMSPVLGPRGTAFMADTYGIHAGVPPTERPRLILQAQYSVLPIYAFLYRPVALRGRDGLDRYVNRLMIEAPSGPQ